MGATIENSTPPAYARLFMENVTIVTAVPDSKLASIYRLCAADPRIRYVPVTNEGELPGIVAGAYLGGKRAVMIMKNSGLRQGCEAIVRFAYCHGMPFVMVISYRSRTMQEPARAGQPHMQET